MNNTDIITKLRIAMTDARQNESDFESWMILNEAICDAIDALAEQPAQQDPVFSFQMQLKPGWGGQYPKAVAIGEPDIESLFGKVGDVVTFYTSPPAQRKPLTDEQKDAARWRFLVDNSFDKDGVTQFHVWEHSWEPHSQTGDPTEWKQRVRGPALDRFIDRAIEAAHGIGEKK